MRRAAALVALALFAAGRASAGPASAAQADPPKDRVLVIPFDNTARNSRIVWIGEAAAVLLTDDLNALGTPVFTRDERLQAFERLQVPPAASLSDATVIRVGQLVGAALVVLGSVELQGEDLVVHARSIALDTGRVQSDLTERGPMPDLFTTFERVATRLAPAGASTAALDAVHPSLAAFEQFIKGVLAETPETAIHYLDEALRLQHDLDRARLALWDVYTDRGDHEAALGAVTAVADGSRWARRARFRAGLSQISLKRYDDAFATFTALNKQQTTAAILNNLGVIQLRRGGTPETGVPAYFFTKATEADPADPDYFFNLGYAAWAAKDTQAVIYWLHEAVRLKPSDGEAHYVLGAALAAAGHDAEAAREKELARRLSSTYEQWDRRPPGEAVPKGLERIKPDVDLPQAQRIDRSLTSTEQRDQAELARFYLDRGRRLFEKEDDRQALAELNRALYLSPYEPEAHLLIGRIHLRNGRVPQAVAAFKISLWSKETAAAHVALGEAFLQSRDAAAARAEAERALVLAPGSPDALKLLERAGARH
ncbi:MAG TPA: tetratricopeptide repeat protein [Vicinamibacterales bacterium]|nr:tetratricopeptide repeat protein [Vicinamibacterales bacterium]